MPTTSRKTQKILLRNGWLCNWRSFPKFQLNSLSLSFFNWLAPSPSDKCLCCGMNRTFIRLKPPTHSILSQKLLCPKSKWIFSKEQISSSVDKNHQFCFENDYFRLSNWIIFLLKMATLFPIRNSWNEKSLEHVKYVPHVTSNGLRNTRVKGYFRSLRNFYIALTCNDFCYVRRNYS